jgi:ABC-2 type transport system permease protein
MSTVSGSTFRRDVGLAAWQAWYEQREFWRSRVRGFFTFAFPLMFLIIFGSLYRAKHTDGIPYDDYFVPGILAYGVIATTFVNMALNTSVLRDEGVLKRMQGTPLPRWAYVAGRIASTVLLVGMITVLTIGVGVIAYGVHFRASTLPGLIISLLLGTAAFTTLGIGIVRLISNAENAPAIVNVTILPLTFISGIWFTTTDLPKWLQDIAKVFPVRALADSLQYAFNPYTVGAGIKDSDILTLLVWTAIGILSMLGFLRHPQGEA